MKNNALEGIKILDFTQMTQGPWATQMLAEMGAEVIKIERPETGELRRHTKVAGQQLGGEASHFLAVNCNKKGITLDLKTQKGRDICLELGEEADVIVHNFRPDVMERLDLTYEDFKEVNNEIIYCQTTGYGTSGPHADKPGQDLLIQAMSGLASITGRKNDPPTPAGVALVDYHAATLLAYGIMVALFHKARSGEGQCLDLNLFNAALDVQHQELFNFMNMDIPLERSEAGISSVAQSAPYGIYETEDGYLAIASLREEDIRSLADLLELPHLTKKSESDFYTERDEIKRDIGEVLRTKSTEEWLELLESHDVWCAPVRSYPDVVNDSQVEHNEMIETVDHPDAGELEIVGIPVKLSETPGEVQSAPPRLGEHTEDVLSTLGYSKDDIRDLKDENVI